MKLNYKIDFRSELTREMVYVMSAHGPIQKYLANRMLSEDPTCRFCLEEEVDIDNVQWKRSNESNNMQILHRLNCHLKRSPILQQS